MTGLASAASEHGATRGIAEAIARILRQHGLEVVVLAPQDVSGIDRYDAVVPGGAVHAGPCLKPARGSSNAAAANRTPTGVAVLERTSGWPFAKACPTDGREPDRPREIQTATRARDRHMFADGRQKRDLTRPQRAALALFAGFQGYFRDRAEIQRWAGGRGQSRCPEPELTQSEVQVAYQTAAA